MHIHEPDCGVKEALEEGKISRERYDSYVELCEELKEKRRY
jgi:ribosome biogenesis GTPase